METGGLEARRLRYALAASLFLHVLVLWPHVPRLLDRNAPLPLQATLLTAPAPVTSPTAPLAIPAARPAAPPPKAVADSTVPKPAVIEPAAPVASTGTPPPASAAPGRPAAPVESDAPPSGVAEGAALSESSASGQALEGLRGYRLAVASQARRFKRYPAQAMEAGWTGTTEVRVDVGADGRPRPASVTKSAGHELLDRAALTMIDAGALRARVPDSLRGKAFAVMLPVVFNLDGD